MEGKNSQPTQQQGKTKKNMAPVIIIVILVLVIIPIVVGLFVWNSARKTIAGQIIKKGLEQEIGNVSKPDEVLDDVFDRVDSRRDEVLDDTSDRVDSTIDQNVSDEDAKAWMNDFDVEFGEFTAIKEGYTHDTKLEVIITNKSNERKSCSLKVDAMSPEGFRIKFDTTYVRDLAPGQKEKIVLFKYISESIIEDMKLATFEVSELEVY